MNEGDDLGTPTDDGARNEDTTLPVEGCRAHDETPATVPTTSQSRIPDRIAHYEIRRELGRGGQGVVYLAYDTKLDRDVALKALFGFGALSEDARRRFEREARAASRLDHPAICTVYDSDVVNGVPYIAMQYVEGSPLSDRIRSAQQDSTDDVSFAFGFSQTATTADVTGEDPIAPVSGATTGPGARSEIDDVLAMVATCARALHEAHLVGLVHRDVKPGNIMLTKEGHPILLDFGLARVDDGQDPLTMSGDVLGTPAYMAPEQVLGHGHEADARTDVYSLGATLFECLTLRRPFTAPTRDALYRAILEEVPPSSRKLNPKIPKDLDVILQTALEKEPRRRYDSAAAFADDLERICKREPIRARPAGPVTRTIRWTQRHPALAATLVALFLALTTGLIVSLSFWRESETERARVTVQRNDIRKQKEEIERLADARILDDLLRRERMLWPPSRALVADLDRWVDEADDLMIRLPVHEATLASLREQARRDDAEDAPEALPVDTMREAARWALAELEEDEERADSIPAVRRLAENGSEAHRQQLALLEKKRAALRAILDRPEREDPAPAPDQGEPTATFDDDRLQWRHDRLVDLIAGLRRLRDDGIHGSGLRSVRQRLEDARSLRRRSIGAHGEAWDRCLDRMIESPGYETVDLEPQLGLVPLGRDRTGLFEFAHVLTGEVPRRDAGDLVLTERSALVLTLIPGGRYAVGTDTDPDRTAAELRTVVSLAPFFVGKHEVTQAQWLRVMGTNPSAHPFGVRPPLLDEDPGITAMHPMENVSWQDCGEFCRRVGLALPTEAQWEVAARGGHAQRFHWGEHEGVLEGRANVTGQENRVVIADDWIRLAPWTDAWPVHAPVNATAANRYGIVGVFGNVGEWCRDAYSVHRVFSTAPGDGLNLSPPVSGSRTFRVFRGGTFQHPPIRSRVTLRNVIEGEQRAVSIGFRVARPIDP